MIARLLLAAVTLTVAACQTTSAVQTRITPRQGERVLDWPWQESDLTVDPAVRYGQLPNGMRYAIRQNRTPTGAASFRLRFDVGSLMEEEDQRGLAHFLEHMAFNGSTNVPEGEMVRLLQRHGLAFGAHTNASTSFDETIYNLDAPNTEEETLDTILFLMREIASNLSIAPAAVDRERGVVLSEERARNTPDLRATQAEWDALYPHARFAERMPIGLVDVLRNVPAERLRDFYEGFYRPERAFFVVSGDIDVDAMEAKIRTTFGDWRAARPDPGDPDLGAYSGGATVGYFHDPGLGATTIELASLRPPLREANTTANVERVLLHAIADSIITRRLSRLARAPGANFISGAANTFDVFDTLALSSVTLSTRPENWEATLQLGETEIRRALQFGFTQAEVDEQVTRLRTLFATDADSANTRPSAGLADEIVNEFSNWGVDMDPVAELALFDRISSRFTRDTVHQAFRQEWADVEPRVFVSSSSEISDVPSRALAALSESHRIAVTPPDDALSTSFAYTSSGSVGTVAERNEITDLGITTVVFANNVRLNLKPTDFVEQSISVRVRFGGGVLELPPSQPGLHKLVPLLIEGGLEAHSADELQSLFAGRNVQSSVSAGADAFLLTARTTPEDLELQLQLMAAYVIHPGYRDEAMERFHQSLGNYDNAITATPNGLIQRDVPRLLRSGDVRYGVATQEELMARSFDELRAAMTRATSRGAIEIGIVGDVDVDRAIALVASTFGALPARDSVDPPFAEARQLDFPQVAREPHVLQHQGEANRAVALVFWPTIDDRDAKAMRTLELLGEVLQIRLVERVREGESATYSPAAQAFFSHANPGYGYVGVSLDLVPDDISRFFRIVDEITTSLAAGEITADELERARRPVLDDFRNRQENNGYWIGLVAMAQSAPDLLAIHRTAVADYESVTLSDLRVAARRYLASNGAYRIAILPQTVP